MTEEWRDIPGIDGYQASSLGAIRGVPRTVKCGKGQRLVKGNTLRAFVSERTGYLQVALHGDRHSVHRLIAMTWCAGYFDGAVVDHRNGDRKDNRAENLEWVTVSENCRRGFALGRVNPFAGKISADHPVSKAVISTHLRSGDQRYFASASDAVREGFESSCISRCCYGISKSHKGFSWRFAHETERSGFTDARESAA